MESRVFVVQNQHRWNSGAGQFEPKFDLSPATEYGRLEYLLSPTASPFHPDDPIEELHSKLKDFGPNDHLLLIGNPILIGLSVSVASYYNKGAISMLQWSGKDNRYIQVAAENIFPAFS